MGLLQLLDRSEQTVVCSFQEIDAVPASAESFYSELVPCNLSRSVKTIGREVPHIPDSIRKDICGSVYKSGSALDINHNLSVKDEGKDAFNIKRKLAALAETSLPHLMGPNTRK